MNLQNFKIWDSVNYSNTLDLVNDKGELILSGLLPSTIIAQINHNLKWTNDCLDKARKEMKIWVIAKTSKSMILKSSNEYEYYLNRSLALQTAIEWINNGTMQTCLN